MLDEVMDAGCTVLQAYMDRGYTTECYFKYHIQVLRDLEFQEWCAVHSYRGSYNAKHDRYYVPFPDGEVFCCV